VCFYFRVAKIRNKMARTISIAIAILLNYGFFVGFLEV
jgi:hypothetical protein